MQVQQSSILQLLVRMWWHVESRRRQQFGILLLLTLIAAFAEIFSIGAVLPFIAILTTPERVFEHYAVQPYIHQFAITEPRQLLLPLTILFGVAAILAGVMRLLLLWATTRISFAVGADLGINIYQRTLLQPYAVHSSRNSSEVISVVSGKVNSIIHNAIYPVLMLISSAVMLVAILAALISVDPFVALLAFAGFGTIYIGLIKLSRKKLLADSKAISQESVKVIKVLQEGLGGIRDVLIDGSQAAYCQVFRKADIRLRRAQGRSAFIGNSPRFAMEALGMLLIAALAYWLALRPEGIAQAIPILGALALGAQRLLPVLQQAYAAWAALRGGQSPLEDTLELLDQPLPAYFDAPVLEPMPFKQSITLRQVVFHYGPDTPQVLKGIDLTLPKGAKIGFIGVTGSGKSTLLDIIMGLLFPSTGVLEVDGKLVNAANQRAWHAHIAHVPQAIFLADSTIEENIAFGIPLEHIDHARVRHAARQAQIATVIESWPQQYQTLVGERGIRLSGGQRQRIGIARALYKKADVIIFDEATSALDNETEQAVMEAIESLSADLTVLIIAHRLTTLKNCTQIVELADGQVQRVGTYQEIVDRNIH